MKPSSRPLLAGLAHLLLVSGAFLALRSPLDAQLTRREFAEIKKEIEAAARTGDVNAYVRSLDTIRTGVDDDSVRTLLGAYSRLAEVLVRRSQSEDLHFVHGETLQALAAMESPEAVQELERTRTKGKDWRERLLVLDAAAFHDGLDLEAVALDALADEHPSVVRRSLRYLSRDQKLTVVDRIVERFLAVESKWGGRRDVKPGTRSEEVSEWSRTLLAFRGALQRLLWVDLSSAADWKNWLAVHRDRPNLFEEPEEEDLGRTAVTLFGVAVTGKNIAFVLDRSGSMDSTDPVPPPGARGRGKGRTGVAGAKPRGVPLDQVEARRRLTRAKAELTNVVRSLASDVRFNLISYSSDVEAWKKSLVTASDDAKDEAARFIDSFKAEGITVTDMALEAAFADLDVDTIYLITDGAPTHVGSQTADLPPDSKALMEQIIARTRTLNFLRDVRIFTLGFREAEVDFLEKLSSENGGRFVAIE